MGNPSPGSKLKKTTTPPSKTIHWCAPSVTSLSLDNIGKDVASPEKSNGTGRFVASTSSPAGGSGEKGMSPASKDAKLRRRVRSSLGGTEDVVIGDGFNAGTPPAEEKKHPFLLARGGIGKNGIRSSNTSQPLQSPAAKQCITTPPGKEKTALGRAASASIHSPRKVDMNSKKAEKEISLTKTATAKSVKVLGDSAVIGRPKQNQSVQLHARRKLVTGDNSCHRPSSDVSTTSKPDLERGLISEPLASEGLTRPEIMELVEVPVYIEVESGKESIYKEVTHGDTDQLHLPTLDTGEETAAVSRKLQPILDYAQEVPSVPRLKSETSFGQDKDIPTYLPSEEVSNGQGKLEALHSSDTDLTSVSLTSLQGLLVEQGGQVASLDDDFVCCLPSEEVTKLEKILEGLESADTDERKPTLQILQPICSDLACQKQGWNDTDVEDPVVSTMNQLLPYELSDNVSSAQEHQVDQHIADTRSVSTCAISSESPSTMPVGAQEEIFSTPAISEALRVSRKDILTGFSSGVLCSSEVSHTSITQQEFAKIDSSNNAVATFQQEAVGFPLDTSLERSTTLDEDHGMSRDLDTADSLCMELMPNSVCHSAEDSGIVGDANQDLAAASRQNDLLYPSKDVESHIDVLDVLEEDSHALRTHTPVCCPDGLHEVIAPLDNDQETYKNKLYSFHSATLIDSLDGFHDILSEQTTSPICTQETDIQAGTSIVAQQAELCLKEAPSITDANQEWSASMGITPTMFDKPPSLDTSPEFCNASPVPYAEQAPKATKVNVDAASLILGKLPTSSLGLEGSVAEQESRQILLEQDPHFQKHSLVLETSQQSDSAGSFFKEISSSSDDEGESSQKSPASDHSGDMRLFEALVNQNELCTSIANFLTFSGETANKDLGEAAVIQHESCQDSVTRVMDLNRSVEPLDCLKSENGNSLRVQEVLEGLTDDPENGNFADAAEHSVDEESTSCLLQEPLNCPKSESQTSPKLQEVSEQGSTDILDCGACAEKARHGLDEGITHSLIQEPLDCPENGASQKLQELSKEGLTYIPAKANACAEEARQTVDEGSTLCLLPEPLCCPISENGSAQKIQVSDNGLSNIPENGAHADEARHSADEGRKACLLQELLESRNGTLPKIKEVSEEGVTNIPENGTCAEEATDCVGEGITPCLSQEPLHCPKSGNNISLKSQEASEGVAITLENGTCAAETADSVDEGSKTCMIEKSSLIPLEMGVGASVLFAEGIFRETGSAVQKDLMPADGGPAKELPHATGDGKAPAPMTEDVQPLHVDTQAEAIGVVLHQELGADEKTSSTRAQDLACEALRDTDKTMLEDLGMAAGPGVAPSPMKPIETRPTTVAGSDTVYGREAGESPVSMDCMFGGAVEDTDEGQIERLDTIESFELELSTEDDGNSENDESSGSSLLQYDLASSQGLESLKDHADCTSDIAEKSDMSNKMSEASLDMLEDHVLDDAVLQFSTELDTTMEYNSAIPPQGPVINGDPIIAVGTVARNTSMVISSIPENGERGEHHTDPVYLGGTQKQDVPQVNLCKQEEEITGEVAAHKAPLLETRHAPILQYKSGFCAEEPMMEGIVRKEVDPFAREVYLEASPVETPGNEEDLSCLKKLPKSHEVENSDTMVSVATQDNSEGCLPETILEMLEDKRSESNVNEQEQWSHEEQYMFAAADSNNSAVSTESIDGSEAFSMTNQEKQGENSAEVLEMLEDDRSDIALEEQDQKSFEKQPMFCAADSNDSAVLMENLDNSEAFSVTNHEKQEEISADALEMPADDKFESEVDYQENRSPEEQPMFIAADSNDSAVLMENVDKKEPLPMTNQEKHKESTTEAPEMLEDDRPESEVNYQEQRSLEEQLMFVAADSNDSAGLTESLDNSEAFPVTKQENQGNSSAAALEMQEDSRSESEVSGQEQSSVEEEQPMFVAADSNDSAIVMKSLDNSEAFPLTSQEKQEESSPEAVEMLEGSRAESEDFEKEQMSLEEKQPKFVVADSNDSAVLTKNLSNSEAFPMTNQDEQDESSAESLEMAEDGRLESEANGQEQRILEEQPMLVAADSHDSALFTANLDNSETFPVSNQENQEDSSAKALEMLQNDRSEMEIQEQDKRFLEEQPIFFAADSNDSTGLTESLDNSEAFPVTKQENQGNSSAAALEMQEDSRSESEVSEQEQRSVEEEQPMFFAADSNDLAVLMESPDNSEAFPLTTQEKQEESSAEALEMPEDSRSECEVSEQEQRSVEEEQPMVVAADSNDLTVLVESLDNSEPFPVTNEEKQEESSAAGLEMLEDDRSAMEVQEQEQGSLKEQPIFVAADSNDISVLTERLGNSEALPVTNQVKRDESSAESLEMLEDDRSEMEVQEQEKGSLEEQRMFFTTDSNDSAVLTECQDNSEALPVANQEKQEESSAEALEMLEDTRSESEVIEQEQRSVEEEQPMLVAANSNDSAVLTESLDNSEAFPVTNQLKQDDISAVSLEMLEDDRSEMEVEEQEKGGPLVEQPMSVTGDSNDSAVLTESEDNTEALPAANQEKQEERSAEVLEMLEDTRPESENIEQEKRSVEEEQTMFVAADSNDSAVLKESLETFPVTNQENQEESSAGLEMPEDNISEMEVQEQEKGSLEEQAVSVAAESNDSVVLTESQENSQALSVYNQEKQEENSAESLEMLEVARSENEASEQEQRSFEHKLAMFVAAESNDSTVLTESLDNSKQFPVTNWEKQEESSAEGLEMLEDGRSESDITEQEQRSLEKQPMFVAAHSNDSAVVTKDLDTTAAFATQERQEESSAEALEPLEDDRSETKRSLAEKSIFVAADSNDSAVFMESLDNSELSPLTNQEQEGNSGDALEMLEDDRFETEVNEQEKRSPEQPICVDTNEQPTSADTNDSTVLVEDIDNSEAFPETNQEKREEISAELAADVLPCFKTSHAPAMQENSVCPEKRLGADDVVGEEVHPILSLGPVFPSAITPENEAEEFNKEYSVSGYSTELFGELAKSEGFDGVNGIDEQEQRSAHDEASQLYSQLQTRDVLSIQDSSSDQAQESLSDENAGEKVDPVSRHSLNGASPIITGGNEQEKRNAEADRSFDGRNSNIDVSSVPETSSEIIDLNKPNSPSQDEISCDGVQAQKDNLVQELAAVDCGEPSEKDGHADANGSETAETNNDALPLSGSRQPKEHSFNVSQASPTYSISNEFPASHQNGMLRDSSSEVKQTQTADQDDSSTTLKALPETAEVHELAPTACPVLGQHPISSSDQDHLWEEQADTYSNGSRGTAAHLEEAAADSIHSLKPGAAMSPDDQILPALGQVKNILPDVVAYSTTVENGSTNEAKMGKSKSHTQLRNLLAEDVSKASNGSISTGLGGSPLKRLFSRLMGNPTKLGEKGIKEVKKRKPSVWNACLGVSAVQ